MIKQAHTTIEGNKLIDTLGSFASVLEVLSTEVNYPLQPKYVKVNTIRENKSGVVPTLLASMGTGGNNVPLILTEDGEIRKLTPRECFNTQGFPRSYKFPEKMANSHLYKQALEKTFDKVIGLADEVSEETIEVSAKYSVYVETAKDLIQLSLEDKKSGKKVHELHISVSKDLDVFFSGSTYGTFSSLPLKTL